MVLQGIYQKEKWSYKVFVYIIYVPLSIIAPIRLKEPNQILIRIFYFIKSKF